MNSKLKTFLSQGELMLVGAKAIGTALFLSGVLVWVVSAQEKASGKSISANPTPTPVADALALTPSEVAARQAIITEYAPFQRELTQLWEKMISTDDEEKAIGLWYKAKATSVKANAVGNKFLAWLKAAQESHHCIDCELKDDKFIPKPMPGGEKPSPGK